MERSGGRLPRELPAGGGYTCIAREVRGGYVRYGGFVRIIVGVIVVIVVIFVVSGRVGRG
jgi:hypothetical protein